MCWALESGRIDAVVSKKGKLAFSRGQTAAYKSCAALSTHWDKDGAP